MKSSYDPHSVYGYDPDTGVARELPEWMRPGPVNQELETAARAAAVAERYRVLDERKALRS
jgi:hypothetical protein